MAVEDIEEPTLYCSVQGISHSYMEYIEHALLHEESIQCGWTLHLQPDDHEDEPVHNCYVVVVKKQLGIFIDVDVFQMLFSASPKKEATKLQLLQAYQYYCSV